MKQDLRLNYNLIKDNEVVGKVEMCITDTIEVYRVYVHGTIISTYYTLDNLVRFLVANDFLTELVR